MKGESSVALVTGAASGIGRATAIALARSGSHVICADINSATPTVEAIAEEGLAANARTLDVQSNEAWEAVVRDVLEKHGEIGILANVAGMVAAENDTVLDQTEELWQRIIDVDLKGVWLGMRAVIPHMVARGGGRIINVASLAGLIGLPNLAAYSAAKGGVIALSRQAAMQYADKGINVNVVCPGLIETPMLGDITEEMNEAFAAATPLGRVGQPEDIATTIVHLAGPGGDFITGQALTIDGGWSAQ